MRYRFEISGYDGNICVFSVDDDIYLTDFMKKICGYLGSDFGMKMHIDKTFEDGTETRYAPGGIYDSDRIKLSYVMEIPGENMMFHCGFDIYALHLKGMTFGEER